MPAVALTVDAQMMPALAFCLTVPSFKRYIWEDDQLGWNVGGPWPYNV